jgi:hypothetical protein
MRGDKRDQVAYLPPTEREHMTTARPLAAATGALGAGVPGPAYDRSQLTVGIVHVGTGAFLRSHQAAYLDRLMADGRALNWAICGVDLLPADRPKAARSRPRTASTR